MTLVMTIDLAARVENSEIQAMDSRLSGILNREGNPMGIEICEMGGSSLFTARGIPGPSYNKVLGLTDKDILILDDIIEFYLEKEIACRFEIIPGKVTQELFQALSKRGYYQCGFHTALYGSLLEMKPKMRMEYNIQVREIEQDEFMFFSQVYCKGFGMPDFLIGAVAENNSVLFDNDKWKHYFAMVDGKLAAVAVLFISEKTANLAAAATLQEFRARGAQNILLRTRMFDAIKAECELIVGQATFGSTSMMNMQRQGMNIAYNKAIWVAG